MSEFVEIFTDGACLDNPGPGGWAYVLRRGRTEYHGSGSERFTTNNKMELTAAIKALEALEVPSTVRLYTDSQYLQMGITQWIKKWKKNGWKTVSQRPVKNLDLWHRLDELTARHEVQWIWIKGHAGYPGNETAHQMATLAAKRFESRDSGLRPNR
jgi:ribonuclease HI